jgi:hypothetical protein
VKNEEERKMDEGEERRLNEGEVVGVVGLMRR